MPNPSPHPSPIAHGRPESPSSPRTFGRGILPIFVFLIVLPVSSLLQAQSSAECAAFTQLLTKTEQALAEALQKNDLAQVPKLSLLIETLHEKLQNCIPFQEVKVATSTLKVHGPFGLNVAAMSKSSARRADRPEAQEDETSELRAAVSRVSGHAEPSGSPETDGTISSHPSWTVHPKKVGTFDVSGWDLNARDLGIAASHTHLVLTGSHSIAFATKTGTLLKSMDTATFFKAVMDDMNKVLTDPIQPGPLKYSINEFYDTRLIFDDFRNRFWVECLVRNPAPIDDPELLKHRVTMTAVAVSKTENPLDGFYGYWWGAGSGKAAIGARDSQSLGISEKLLVLARQTDEVPVAQADSMAAGSPSQPPVTLLKDINVVNGKAATINLTAVLHHGASPRGRQLFASSPGWDRLVVWALDPQKLGTLLRAEVPITASESPHTADQKSHSEVPQPQQVDPGITWMVSKAVYRDGKLYAVWPVGRKWGGASVPLSSIQLVRLDVSGLPWAIPVGPSSYKIDRVFGKGNAADPAGTLFSYCWPTLDVTQDGTMAFGYMRSGATIFPEVRYSLYGAWDPDVSPSVLLHAGEYPLTRLKQIPGTLDYTGSAVDPADGRTVYVLNGYGSRQDSGKGGYKLIVGKLTL